MVGGRERLRRPGWLSVTAAEAAVSATWLDIVSLMPERIGRVLLRSGGVLFLDLVGDGGAVEATLPDGRRLDIADAADAVAFRKEAGRRAVVLRLRETDILVTVLQVPRRALRRLDEVATTNIPIWTPFAADSLYFKARPLEDEATGGAALRRTTSKVELRCVPKAALEPCVSTLIGTTITPDAIWLGDDPSFAVDLHTRKTRRGLWRRRAACLLIGLAVLQLGALSLICRLRLDQEIVVLQAGIAEVRRTIQAEATRRQRDRDAARTLAAVEDRATGRNSVGHAIGLLAGVLPAGARYTELSLNRADGGSPGGPRPPKASASRSFPGDDPQDGGASIDVGRLTVVSKDRIDPVAMVAATGSLTVTEVSEANRGQEAEHGYSVAFKAVRSAPDPE